MTVDAGRARSGVAGLEHETALDRQVKQVGELAVFLGVAPDQEDILIRSHAAGYSLMTERAYRLRISLPSEAGGSVPNSTWGLEEGRLYGKETDW